MKKLLGIILPLLLLSCSAEKELLKIHTELEESVINIEIVSIGNQEWMKQNLDTELFQNGDTIFHASTNDEWKNAAKENKPAWCYYENDSTTSSDMGKIYNWYAVNDIRNIAPTGFKVPSMDDWNTLIDTLGGPKSAGIQLMDSINWIDGTGSTGFDAFPGGGRGEQGTFGGKGSYCFWWSTSDFSEKGAYVIYLYNDQFWGKNGATKDGNSKEMGFTVRCLKIRQH